MTTAPAYITKYTGDTWLINVQFVASDGVTALNLTTASLTPKAYLLNANNPSVPLAVSSTPDPTQGLAQFVAAASMTNSLPTVDPARCFFQAASLVRVHVTLTDSTGAESTYAVIPVQVLAP